MRKVSHTRSPNYAKRDDPDLLRHGIPDLTFTVEGYRLHVHSKILCVYSDKIFQAMLKPDPMFGNMIQLAPYKGRRRTKPGALALFNAIYPPQLVPPAHLFDEVCDIAEEYGMELLLERIKLGIIKSCDLEPLKAAEQGRTKMHDTVISAFAEFELDELKQMPGYDELKTSTKIKIAQRRVALLDFLMTEKHMKPCREAHKYVFRKYPQYLTPQEKVVIAVGSDIEPSSSINAVLDRTRSTIDNSGTLGIGMDALNASGNIGRRPRSASTPIARCSPVARRHLNDSVLLQTSSSGAHLPNEYIDDNYAIHLDAISGSWVPRSPANATP